MEVTCDSFLLIVASTLFARINTMLEGVGHHVCLRRNNTRTHVLIIPIIFIYLFFSDSCALPSRPKLLQARALRLRQDHRLLQADPVLWHIRQRLSAPHLLPNHFHLT